MTFFIPGRVVRLGFVTLAGGCTGLLPGEVAATVLAGLMVLVACCRSPFRLELMFCGILALATRHWHGDFAALRAMAPMLLALVIALCGFYTIMRAVFGSRESRLPEGQRSRHWGQWNA